MTTASFINGDRDGILGSGREATSRDNEGIYQVVSFPSREWDAAWLGYEMHELNQRHSPKSIRTRRSSVTNLAKRFPETPPEKLTKHDLRLYFLEQHQIRKPGGVVSRYNDLKSFFRWVAADYEIVNPLLGVPRQTADMPDVPVLEPDQLRKLLAACKGRGFLELRDHLAIMMLFETGLRRTELISIQLDDIDQQAMSIRVRIKGGKIGTAFYGKDTADALRKYLRVRAEYEGTALYLNYKHEPLGYAGVGQLVARRGKMAGIEGLHPHVLRHTACHYLRESGVQDSDVIVLMRWTNGTQLKRYGRAKELERAAKAVRAHPLGDVLRRR